MGLGTAPGRRRHTAVTDKASPDQQPRPAGRRHRQASYLGVLAYTTTDGPGPRRHNSAHRLRSLWYALELPEDLRGAIAGYPGGPVLLIDDRIETGWTMTVAAKLLMEAGTPAVLPLALAATTG